MTGETYPVEKIRTNLMPDTPLASRVNTLLMGTNVVSGTAIAVVVHTGPQTELGKVSDRLRLRPPETGFERGVRRFGYFLMELTMILVIAIFAINALLGRPALQSLLFSLAIAVGLTPQLLSMCSPEGASVFLQNAFVVLSFNLVFVYQLLLSELGEELASLWKIPSERPLGQ